MYYPLSFCVPHAFDYWGINILVNSMALCNTGTAWKMFLYHVGPGFMVCLAYLDPGNCTLCTISSSISVLYIAQY